MSQENVALKIEPFRVQAQRFRASRWRTRPIRRAPLIDRKRRLPLWRTHESPRRLEIVDRVVLLSVWQMTNELRLTTDRLIDPQMQALLFVAGVHLAIE